MSAVVTDRLRIPLRNLGAALRNIRSFGPRLLFAVDIDGTMDTWHSHARFIRELRKQAYCRSLPSDTTPAFEAFDLMNQRDLGGWTNIFRTISRFIEEQHQCAVSADAIRGLADSIIPELLGMYPVEPRPGLASFIERFLQTFPEGEGRGKFTVVTNSSPASVQGKLDLLQVAQYFPDVDYDDGSRSENELKPNAEAFLRVEHAVFGTRGQAAIVVCEDSVENVIDLLKKSPKSMALLFPRAEAAEELYDRIMALRPGGSDYVLRDAMMNRRLAIAEDWVSVCEHVLAD